MNLKFSNRSVFTAIAVAATLSIAGGAHAQSVLDTVKERGVLRCGTDTASIGFGYTNPQSGRIEGLDADLCRAIAAGVLGDSEKLEFIPVSSKSRFDAVATGQVDIAFAHATIIPVREGVVGVDFIPVTYYDGSGFMVKSDIGVTTATEIDGGTLCTVQGSGTEVSLAAYIRRNAMSDQTRVLTFQDVRELFEALDSGGCDAMFTDKSRAAAWSANSSDPSKFTILAETIDKSPQAGYVVENDSEWRDAASFIIYGLFQAEEYGVTMGNLAQMQQSEDPNIRKFLGSPGDFGEQLGLPGDFMSSVISGVGSYAEIFDRNLGPSTPMGIQRDGSLNDSWQNGGMMFSPPWL